MGNLAPEEGHTHTHTNYVIDGICKLYSIDYFTLPQTSLTLFSHMKVYIRFVQLDLFLKLLLQQFRCSGSRSLITQLSQVTQETTAFIHFVTHFTAKLLRVWKSWSAFFPLQSITHDDKVTKTKTYSWKFTAYLLNMRYCKIIDFIFYGRCMFSLCLCRFSRGTLTSSHSPKPKLCVRLTGASKLALGVSDLSC